MCCAYFWQILCGCLLAASFGQNSELSRHRACDVWLRHQSVASFTGRPRRLEIQAGPEGDICIFVSQSSQKRAGLSAGCWPRGEVTQPVGCRRQLSLRVCHCAQQVVAPGRPMNKCSRVRGLGTGWDLNRLVSRQISRAKSIFDWLKPNPNSAQSGRKSHRGGSTSCNVYVAHLKASPKDGSEKCCHSKPSYALRSSETA